ncbi:MAG TPA: hypothetical protein VKL21_08400, partial [Candidatus Methanoperedens sp.]|nr:hypothetical protein [Candidatus Methanoperedens sp.]
DISGFADIVFAIFISMRVRFRETSVERITKNIPITTKGTRAESSLRKGGLLFVLGMTVGAEELVH